MNKVINILVKLGDLLTIDDFYYIDRGQPKLKEELINYFSPITL